MNDLRKKINNVGVIRIRCDLPKKSVQRKTKLCCGDVGTIGAGTIGAGTIGLFFGGIIQGYTRYIYAIVALLSPPPCPSLNAA
jgi:hypothetical protein